MSNSTLAPDAGPGRASPERRDPVGARPNIRVIKNVATIEDEGRRYGPFRRAGANRFLGLCIFPGHDEKTASLNLYTDTQRFKCYGCSEGGDVIDLVMLAEGCEFHEALVMLAQRHDVRLPGRPDSWYRRQERQRPVRDGINRARFVLVRKRLYRRYFAPLVESVEDPEERAQDEQALWEATEPLARHLLASMRKGASDGS